MSPLFFHLNDSTAFEIGLDLPGSTCIDLEVVISSRLSENGVKTFLQGLRRSKIQRVWVTIDRRDRPLPTVVQLLGQGVMNVVPELGVNFMDDADASFLELLLVNAGIANTQKLNLYLGPLTTQGAQRLVRTIRKSSLERMEVSAEFLFDDPVVATILYARLITKVASVRFENSLNNSQVMKLGKVLSGNTTLKAWSFESHGLELNGARELAKAVRSSQIEKLAVGIHYSSIVSNAWRIFFSEGLRESASRLTSLELNLQNKDDHSHTLILPIAECLPFLTSLKRLHLFGFNVGDEGAASFVANWNTSSPLEELDLNACEIGTEGARHIAGAMSNHAALVTLRLKFNKIGSEGIQALAAQLPNPTLKELNFTGDYVYNESSVREAALRALLKGIPSSFHLQVLKLPTYLALHPNPHATEINFFLKLIGHGRYLLHTHHELPAGVWSRIFAKCNDEPSVIYYLLREQPNLVTVPAVTAQRTSVRRGRDRQKRRRVS